MYNFIVYSETNKEIATSYISLIDFDEIAKNDFFIDGFDTTKTQEEKEIALINATNYIDSSFVFNYNKKDEEQRLYFPIEIEEELDDNIKIATAYVASKILNNKKEDLILTNEEREVESESFAGLSVSYKNSKKTILNKNEYLFKCLKKYLFNGIMEISR